MSSPARDIEAVLDESGPDYDELSFERPTAGHQGEVFLVTLDYQGEEYEIVVKFQTGGDETFALEPKLHEYVADRVDIPVPHILIFRDDPKLDVPPYFVTERVEGDNLAESLAKLDDDRLVVEEFSWDWQQFSSDMVDGYIDRLGKTPFADLQDSAREYVADAVGVIENDGVPRLVHDDFRPANMLFDPAVEEPITAVLDWQFALAAHPEYHLARTDFLFIDPAFENAATRERLRDRLYAGYREFREFEPDDGYERRRAVYHFATLLWRMGGFEAAFADFSELAKARAEARFRQQFDQLASVLPEA